MELVKNNSAWEKPFARDNDSEIPDNFPYEEMMDENPYINGELQFVDGKDYRVTVFRDS